MKPRAFTENSSSIVGASLASYVATSFPAISTGFLHSNAIFVFLSFFLL